jgi:hypothetical protein
LNESHQITIPLKHSSFARICGYGSRDIQFLSTQKEEIFASCVKAAELAGQSQLTRTVRAVTYVKIEQEFAYFPRLPSNERGSSLASPFKPIRMMRRLCCKMQFQLATCVGRRFIR